MILNAVVTMGRRIVARHQYVIIVSANENQIHSSGTQQGLPKQISHLVRVTATLEVIKHCAIILCHLGLIFCELLSNTLTE